MPPRSHAATQPRNRHGGAALPCRTSPLDDRHHVGPAGQVSGHSLEASRLWVELRGFHELQEEVSEASAQAAEGGLRPAPGKQVGLPVNELDDFAREAAVELLHRPLDLQQHLDSDLGRLAAGSGGGGRHVVLVLGLVGAGGTSSDAPAAGGGCSSSCAPRIHQLRHVIRQGIGIRAAQRPRQQLCRRCGQRHVQRLELCRPLAEGRVDDRHGAVAGLPPLGLGHVVEHAGHSRPLGVLLGLGAKAVHRSQHAGLAGEQLGQGLLAARLAHIRCLDPGGFRLAPSLDLPVERREVAGRPRVHPPFDHDPVLLRRLRRRRLGSGLSGLSIGLPSRAQARGGQPRPVAPPAALQQPHAALPLRLHLVCRHVRLGDHHSVPVAADGEAASLHLGGSLTLRLGRAGHQLGRLRVAAHPGRSSRPRVGPGVAGLRRRVVVLQPRSLVLEASQERLSAARPRVLGGRAAPPGPP
mmetsp:Transcript_18763/g.71403  ORF Transcript_18763/g.71403 Transcript_18763/m.71403 type:complete len:468 (+) Transcript_18763:87-1490(+)